MAATNINRVVLTGNLTRDPELRSTSERHVRLQPARRLQHPPQGPVQRRVGRQAQLLRRHRLGRAGRELRPVPLQGPARRDRRPPRVARVGGQGEATSASRWISLPTPSSSSARAKVARTAAASRRRAMFPPTPGTSSRRRWAPGARTTTFRSDPGVESRQEATHVAKQRGTPRRVTASAAAARELRERGGSSRARSAGTRSTSSTTRTSARSGARSATRARSARRASPAPAAATSRSSHAPSSAPASSACCRTSPTARPVSWPRRSCSKESRRSGSAAT